jgi:hypothetical protein
MQSELKWPAARRAAAGTACALAAWLAAVPAGAQAEALLRGRVTDAAGLPLPGAEIVLRQPLTALRRTAHAADDGTFQVASVPPDRYELRVEFPGFAPDLRVLDLGSSVPVHVEVVLALAAHETAVTVTPEAPLLDTVSAGTRHQVSDTLVARMPAAIGSRGLESAIVTLPGFAQNANGAIHPRGAHNQMTFVLDGLPIGDQLTGAFANAIDAAIVSRAEVITGHVPAEFGSKVSAVAIVTTRSGLGVNRPLAGEVLVSVAGHSTWQGAVQAGGGRQGVGWFGSATAMRTDRFLDQVSLDNLHNAGGFGRGFGRVDWQAGPRDVWRAHAMGGVSRFEVANLRSQEAAGQDQRQRLGDAAAWGSWLRMLDARSTIETVAGYRRTSARLDASAGDTPVTAAQRRHLDTVTLSTRYTRLLGAHEVRAGLDVQRFGAGEAFTMALTSSSFNDPASAGFNPALLAHDLTRGGTPFVFAASGAGRLLGAFVQSTVRTGAVTWSLGLRHDEYRFLARGRQFQPRAGVSWALPGRAGVLRASYNRTYQTPPNENLLLSSSAAAAALAPPAVQEAYGSAVPPIRPERQHVVEAGWQVAPGGRLRIDVSAYRKESLDQQDNNNFFDTGIIFPTSLAGLSVTGVEARLAVPPWRDVSATLSATMGRAVARPPFTGGLFLGQDALDLLSAGPFRIDHDQALALHATAQWSPASGYWAAASVRYDSGLVANPSDPAEVAADTDVADLLPYVNLTAEVPRVRPRTIADLAAGYDVRGGRWDGWSVQVQVTNLTNATALYNFQSVFVGTRLVQPRTVAVRVKRSF